MPKYPLIVSNETYMKLLQHGAEVGKTLGRLINDILNDFVAKLEVDPNGVIKQACLFCQKKPVVKATAFSGQTIFLCGSHKHHGRKMVGYKDLEDVVE